MPEASTLTAPPLRSEAPLAAPEVRRVAAFGAGPDDEVLRVGADRWPSVRAGLAFHRLTGLAVAARGQGLLELDPEHADQLLHDHRSAMLLALAIERRLLRVVTALERAGIRAVVLKGTAVAHALYPDPSLRPFGDLDLLVSSADWRDACSTLRACGFARVLPEPRRGFDERFGKAATHTDADGVQVDLHRTLVLGPFGLWLEPEELLAHTETFVVGGRTIERLDRTGLLLNAALHAGLGASPPLLLPLRDVVQAARDPGVDWDRLGDWAERWRLSAPLAFAFDTVERRLGVQLPPQARRVSARPPSPGELRAMRAYTEHRRAGGLALAATRAIPGIRGKAAYVYGLLLPSREFLRARAHGATGASYRSRWRAPVRWVAARRRWGGLSGAHAPTTTTGTFVKPTEMERDR